MKKLFFLLISATLLAVAFVSCGKDSTENPNTSTYPVLSGAYTYYKTEKFWKKFDFDNTNMAVRSGYQDYGLGAVVEYYDTIKWHMGIKKDTFYYYITNDTTNLLRWANFKLVSPDTFVLHGYELYCR